MRCQRFLLAFFLFCASLGLHAQTPLAPEQAFRFSARVAAPGVIEARWQIAPGYYLYQDKFKFAVEPAGTTLGPPGFPPADTKDDPNFGQVQVFHRDVAVRLPFTGGTGAITLKVQSQGCADMGICYPPQRAEAQLVLAGATTDMAAPGGAVADVAPPASDDSKGIARLLRQGSLWLVLTSFFGFGLLLCFTPCVLPMVPILSGIIVNHGHAVSHARAFLLSLAYVLGMALTYAAAGVAAGYSGALLSSALQNAWVLGGFALVFVALALSMFGFYELQLPTALQSRVSDSANRRGGSLPALFLMGALSALIVGPCVAAPLAGALLYIAQTGNAPLGGMALFTLALGMGAPLLAVGLFSRSLLPKTGPWMDAVKKFFGVVLLATALWLVSPVLPAWLGMLGWAALLIVPAIYLHALDPLPSQARGWVRFWKGVGVAMLLAGATLIIGVMGGSRDPLRPLSFIHGELSANDHSPRFEPVRAVAELEARLRDAGRPVMLDFYADWCTSCKEMERDTFRNPQVVAVMDRMLLLQADVTANNEADRALLARFGYYGPPGIVFFDSAGQEIADTRITGFLAAEPFLAHLRRILG